MSLRNINKKLDEKQRKIVWSMQNNLQNNNSMLFCDVCKNRLGMFKMIRSAFMKKEGTKYYVRCKRCSEINIRTKGDIGKEIDTNWDKYGV